MKVTEKDLIGKIKNIPLEIIQHIIDCGYAELTDLIDSGIDSAIKWRDTKEDSLKVKCQG